MKKLLYIPLLLLIVGCEVKPEVSGEWYKFLVYYKGVRTGQFHVLVDESKRPTITMYQDSEGEKVVYKGYFANDSILVLHDEMNNSGELQGKYSDTSIVLNQYDFTYIGTKSRF